MEQTTAGRKYDTTHENRGPAAQGNAGVTTAVQVPANGLNRAISVKEGESFSEALDESKTSHKSLCDRICDLWLIRKIIGLFKSLLTCLRKDVASSRENAGKLINIEDVTVLAGSLLYKAQALVETIEQQDPSLDQWTETELKLEALSAELTQLKRDIPALMSPESDYEEMAMNYLDTQKTEIERHIDWIKFYLASRGKDNYLHLNVTYFVDKLELLYDAARSEMKRYSDDGALSDKLVNSYFAAANDITEMADKGQISAALARLDAFNSTACSLIIEADLLGRLENREESVTATEANPDISSAR